MSTEDDRDMTAYGEVDYSWMSRLPKAKPPTPALIELMRNFRASQSDRKVEIVARSDAQFDGRDFDGLGRADKKRYLDRAAAGLQAVRRAWV